jgi:cytochrome c oxidase subunit 2
MSDFSRFITQASEMAGHMDALLLALTLISTLVVGGIGLLIVVFVFRYRHGSPRARAALQTPVTQRNRRLEAFWIGVPLVVFLGIFYWATVLYAQLRTPPAEAMTIDVVAKQWMWKVQHPGGQREINQLHLPAGRPVKLVMTSQDVIHSFFVPAFRVKQDVLPGRYTTLWFEPTEPGEYQLFCAEFCGTAHSRMTGSVIVLSPEAFRRWLRANPGEGSLARRGEALFRRHGCSGCHGESATVHAPKLEGLFGRRIPLADGSTVEVDARYIRDAILLPYKEVAAGYAPIMPSFEGQLEEDEILQLVAYIRSLSDLEEAR